jgi:hypothetical protein
MKNWNRLPRFLLVLTLLIGLCAGFFTPKIQKANAAADRLDIVISEFRFVGPQGENDEFIELYNPTNDPKSINGWTIGESDNVSNKSLISITGTLPSIQPGQYFLLVNSAASAGLLALADATYTSSFPSSFPFDGGVALLNGATIVDAVGLSAGSAYKEGTPLAPLSGTADQSYERKTLGDAGNCKDTDNNAADFIWNKTTSNPQNLSSPRLACIVVTNVQSPNSGIYLDTSGALIDIDVTFSTAVNVTGSPTLLMETGVIDRKAIYVSGSGTDTLTFRYTVTPGDSSAWLDYVSANALTLNGGSISGAVGDATLILPAPGDPGSLGANNNIINNNDIRIDIAGPPSVISFKRQDPLTTPTNSGALTFRATFSEAVIGVDINDFIANGTNGFSTTPSSVIQVSGSEYDVIIDDPNLAIFYNSVVGGVVGLDFDLINLSISDVASPPKQLPPTEPSIINDETYTVDYIPPDVTVNQATGQIAPATANGTPVNFTVVFTEAINVSTFTTSDITQNGTALRVTWSIADSGDHKTFTLSALSSGNGTLVPEILADRVTDPAGNGNTASTSTDNSVTVQDNIPPTVTINQAAGQPDPSALPIRFTVVFSEPIITSIFTTADITQNGTATGITWSITDSGDQKTFTLSATAAGSAGTLIPTIAANRVTDMAGNNNSVSTSTDNRVTYSLAIATITPTATSTFNPPVLINEVAWAGTSSATTGDEWIELYNTNTNSAINLNGWKLLIDNGGGTLIEVALFDAADTIPAGGFFLLARSSTCTGTDYQNVFQNVVEDKCFSVQLVNNTTSTINANGQALLLHDPSNNLIDSANLDRNNWPAGSTFSSMERKGKISDTNPNAWGTFAGTPFAVNRNGATTVMGTPKRVNWITTIAPTPTRTPTTRPKNPTKTPIPTLRPVGRPFINEFLPRPGFDWNLDGKVDTFDEFIELKNVGNADLNLNGWKLDDEADHPGAPSSAPYTITDTILKPGEYAVFYASKTNILLSDGGDSVRLFDDSGALVDVRDYTIAKVADESVCRLPDGNAFGSWFSDCTPTPNLTNSRESNVPTLPDGNNAASLYCALPDTLPADFLFAECRGYGANIWDNFYWDEFGWMGDQIVPENKNKWKSFIE